MESNKTTSWILIHELGSYFRYDHGELQFCPILTSGERGADEEVGAVDLTTLDQREKNILYSRLAEKSYTHVKVKSAYGEKLRQIAEREHRTMTNMLEVLIDQAHSKQEPSPTQATPAAKGAARPAEPRL